MSLRMERASLLAVSLLVAAMVPSFASCAQTEGAEADGGDGRVVVPGDAGVEGGDLDASSDGGDCETSADDCVSQSITCDQAPWCPVPTGVSTRYALTAVWGSSKNDIWAVGSGGTIIHFDGAAWTTTPTDLRHTFNAVWGSGPNDVWAVAMTDTILHTTGFTGGTATWTRVPAPGDPRNALPVHAVWGTGPEAVRLGVRAYSFYDPNTGEFPFIDQYTLKVEDDGGIGWDPVEGEGTVLGFWGSSTDLWVVADNSAKNSWQKGMTKHGTPRKGGVFEWKVVDSQSTVVLEGIWGSSADDIWAVGQKGTIRRMRNSAARWEVIESPTQESLHGIWGSGPNDVWAVGDSGTILHWDGTTWTPSLAAFALGKKPNLYGIWGSAPNDVWIVGDGVSLHYTGPKSGGQGGGQ